MPGEGERWQKSRNIKKKRGWICKILKIKICKAVFIRGTKICRRNVKTATNEVWIETHMYEAAEEITEQAFTEQHVRITRDVTDSNKVGRCWEMCCFHPAQEAWAPNGRGTVAFSAADLCFGNKRQSVWCVLFLFPLLCTSQGIQNRKRQQAALLEIQDGWSRIPRQNTAPQVLLNPKRI